MTLYKTTEGERTVMALYDDAMLNWAVPYETRTVATRHGETFVIVSGDADAPPVILLHGAGGNSSTWAGDVRDYAEHFRVYAVDLIGEPGKSAPNRPDWNSDAYAEWLEDVLNALDVEQTVLVGISQGGWTALQFASAFPERVAQLVLIAPGGIVADRTSFLFRAVGSMLLGKWGIKRMVRDLFAEQTVPDGVEEIVVTVTEEFKPRIGVLPVLSDAQLAQLTMPVYLLGGTKDIIRDNEKIAARLREHVPDLTVTIVAGAGHALINTSAKVVDFLMSHQAIHA